MQTVIFDASYVLMDSLTFKKERNIENSKGELIGGSLLTLLAVRNTLLKYPDCDRFIVVWDGGPSARKRELEPNYRTLNIYWKESVTMLPETNEPERYQQYVSQRKILRKIFENAGILQFDFPTLEKEDIIPYLLHKNDGNEYIYVTDDHSLNVLMDENIFWYRPFENVEVHKRALMLNRMIKNWDNYCYAQSIMNRNLDMVKGCCDLVGEMYITSLIEAAKVVGFDEFEKLNKNQIKKLCEENNIPYRGAYENFKADRVRFLEKIYGYVFYPGWFISDSEKELIDACVEKWGGYSKHVLEDIREQLEDSPVDLEAFNNEQIDFRFSSDTKDMFE